jgi:Zn-finger nucleic acid-binding protein
MFTDPSHTRPDVLERLRWEDPLLAPALPCPVCDDVRMRKATVGPVTLDHCNRCGGTWFEKGELKALVTHASRGALVDALDRAAPDRRDGGPMVPCYACGTPYDRDRARCPACDRRNILDCPHCGRIMDRVQRRRVTIDVCGDCRGAWFDHAELTAIWDEKVREAATRPRRRDTRTPGSANEGASTGDTTSPAVDLCIELLDGLFD